MSEKLIHTIASIGLVEFSVYPPADELYRLLLERKEIDRLKGLKHIGAIHKALPGISHSRWDYVASMLYVANVVRPSFANQQVKLGGLEYSSITAAVQVLAFLTNIGHIPGTFSVEKGITRWLFDDPLQSASRKLPWSLPSESLSSLIQPVTLEDIDAYLKENDYLGLNRVLSIVKLVNYYCETGCDFFLHVLNGLYLPFLFTRHREPKEAWSFLEEYYQLARRLAYLNLDATFADVPIRVNIADFIRHMANSKLTKSIIEQAREVLAAYEHSVFEKLYHRVESRKWVAVVAHNIREELNKAEEPQKLIRSWLDREELDLPNQYSELSVNHFAQISIRSHFVPLNGFLSFYEREIEQKLRHKGSVSILVYHPWEQEYQIEPPQFYIDFFTTLPSASYLSLIGRVISWVSRNLDSYVTVKNGEPLNELDLWKKIDLAPTYESLLNSLIQIRWPGLRIELKPWPLAKFGYPEETSRIPVWTANWNFSNKDIAFLLRRRKCLDPALRAQWAELTGLAKLREALRRFSKKAGHKTPRRQGVLHLVLTASIRLYKENNGTSERIAEFDGGIVQVRSRTGKVLLFLLETKSRSSSQQARNQLRNKLVRMGLSEDEVNIRTFRSCRSAYCTIDLSKGNGSTSSTSSDTDLLGLNSQ